MVAVKIYIFLLKLRRTRFKNGVARSAASGRKKAREKGRLNRPSSSRYEKFAARNQPLLLYIYIPAYVRNDASSLLEHSTIIVPSRANVVHFIASTFFSSPMQLIFSPSRVPLSIFFFNLASTPPSLKLYR